MTKRVTTLKSLADALDVSYTRARALVDHGCVLASTEIDTGTKKMREFSNKEIAFVKEFVGVDLFGAINFARYYKAKYLEEKEKNAKKKT